MSFIISNAFVDIVWTSQVSLEDNKHKGVLFDFILFLYCQEMSLTALYSHSPCNIGILSRHTKQYSIHDTLAGI